MNPCNNLRENLALLAAGRLETSAAEALRAHARQCPGCGAYLSQMTALCARLEQSTQNLPRVEDSEVFHQALVARINSERPPAAVVDDGPSVWSVLFAPAWKWAAWGAVAVLLVLGLNRPATMTLPIPVPPPTAVVASPVEPSPSLWAYQRAVGESWENFQTLLANNASQAPATERGVTAFTHNLRGLVD